MRALPLNDVSWLGTVSMRAGGGVGQGELQKGAGWKAAPSRWDRLWEPCLAVKGAATPVPLLPTGTLSCAGPSAFAEGSWKASKNLPKFSSLKSVFIMPVWRHCPKEIPCGSRDGVPLPACDAEIRIPKTPMSSRSLSESPCATASPQGWQEGCWEEPKDKKLLH